MAGGVCMAGGMHGRGCAWHWGVHDKWGGACVAGGVRGMHAPHQIL